MGKTEKVRSCPHCGAYNGKVSKSAQLKILHTIHPRPEDTEGRFDKACTAVKDLAGLLDAKPPKIQEDMTPLVVQKLFEGIPAADCVVLDLSPNCRPEDLLLTTVLAPAPI